MGAGLTKSSERPSQAVPCTQNASGLPAAGQLLQDLPNVLVWPLIVHNSRELLHEACSQATQT